MDHVQSREREKKDTDRGAKDVKRGSSDSYGEPARAPEKHGWMERGVFVARK